MDIATRKKISQTMKGKSNFEGKKHTHATKIEIGISQEGHRNVKDHKWVTDKETGQERRVKGNVPRGMRRGRSSSFQQWIHAKESVETQDGPNEQQTQDSSKRLFGTTSLATIYKNDTPGQWKADTIVRAVKKQRGM